MTWEAATGGDHDGDDWTPGSITIGGIHTNIGTATLTGVLTLVSGIECEIYADSIVQAGGTISGSGKGHTGGIKQSNGAGSGGGTRSTSNGVGGGGGGYGGEGGDGDSASYGGGYGGVIYGSNSVTTITMGSGGGGSYRYSGGNGGGSLLLNAQIITLGTINLNGTTPTDNYDTGGGGGSGGGLLIVCKTLTCSASSISCSGAAGGAGYSSGGGGGGGGRAMFYYYSSDNVPTGHTTTSGGAAGSGGTALVGSVGVENAYSVLCRSSSGHTTGQTFNCNIPGSVSIIDIQCYCSVVGATGSHYLTIYDSPDKNTIYGQVLSSITTTGLKTWTFTSPVLLPDGLRTYYFEIGHYGSAAAGFRYTCNEKYMYGNMYRISTEINNTDMYFVVNAYGNIQNPRIYNTDEKHAKCSFGKMLTGAVHRINSDGTGSICYHDTFDGTNQKYLGDTSSFGGFTQGSGYLLFNSPYEYIEYKYDCKYPITGIPALTSKINLVSGNGKWMVAEEINGKPGIWYDIYDTLPAGNILTTYKLDSPELSFDGHRVLYFRFQNVTGQQNVESITLNIELDTSGAHIPTVNVDGTSTFVCDQDDTSSVICEVSLIYSDAKMIGN